MNLQSFANQAIDRCASTNDHARELGEAGYPHGTWISARTQDHGRGRLGRAWEGAEGNLFLSIVVRDLPPSLWSWVPIATGTSIAQAVQEKLQISARIKWPNDLWIGDAKLGGILCEGITRGAASFIVVGIGLNCSSIPEGLDRRAVSLSSAGTVAVSAEDVRPWIIDAVLAGIAELKRDGSGSIAHKYRELALLQEGAEVMWSSESRTYRGRVSGLGTQGELLVVGPGEKALSLFAEDVSLVLSPAL